MKRRLLIILIASTAWAAPSALAEPLPYPTDYTFRRVTVPQPGSGNRITVQIAPKVQSPLPQITSDPEVPASTAYPWFWDSVSTDLSAQSPGRLEPSLAVLRQAPDGQAAPAPRLDLLQQIAQTHGTDMLISTVGTQVSPALVLAVISVESAGRADAVSGAGAQGLMQLMPATAARFDVADSLNAMQNIRGGVAYLDWLMTKFDRDPILVLAAYNAGEGSIRDHSGVPPYAETRAYVPKVLAAWQVTKAMCITPPELLSDGCVFSMTGG